MLVSFEFILFACANYYLLSNVYYFLERQNFTRAFGHKIKNEASPASRGYHVFQNPTRQNAESDHKVKVEIERTKCSLSIDIH